LAAVARNLQSGWLKTLASALCEWFKYIFSKSKMADGSHFENRLSLKNVILHNFMAL